MPFDRIDGRDLHRRVAVGDYLAYAGTYGRITAVVRALTGTTVVLAGDEGGTVTVPAGERAVVWKSDSVI